MNWYDENGYMFPFGENGIAFALEECILKNNSLQAKCLLLNNYHANGDSFRDYPGSPEPKMSHDNYTMIVCAIKYFKFTTFYKDIQIFSKYRMHTRDIVFYGYLKYPLVFWWFMPIVSIAMIVSCARTWKVRGDHRMIHTDGKILAFFRMKAVKMPITKWICTKLIERNIYFGDWASVFWRYFQVDKYPKHPLNLWWIDNGNAQN